MSIKQILSKVAVIFWAIVVLGGAIAQAQKENLVERVFEGTSLEKNPVIARKAILDEAMLKVSETVIKEIIGDSKYSRNQALVQQKILRKAPRYVPFTRPGELKAAPEGGFKMAVTLKVSLDQLQALLLENGLFYESDGTPTVMPMIQWVDHVRGQNSAWWRDAEDAGKSFLVKENRNLEQALRTAFWKNQFYVLLPGRGKLNQVSSPTFKSDKMSLEDLQNLSRRLGVHILVEGEVHLQKSTERSEAQVIVLKLNASQVQNGRSIAEVSRQVETDPGGFESMVDKKLKELLEQSSQDLASQVFEAWSRGTIGSSLYKINLKGRLPLLSQESFKETLKAKIREVKNVRERFVAPDSLVFEMDSLLSPVELGKRLPDMEIISGTQKFRMTLESSNESEITYRLFKGSEK